MPKEYPELADGSHNIPDSSNRLTSPAPSSEAASPVTRVSRTSVDTASQTEAVSTSSIACQAMVEFKQEELQPVKKEDVPAVPEKRRGCPKGGWPGRKKKKMTQEFVTNKIKEILERSSYDENNKLQCELCLLNFKKIFKLKLHLIKSHSGDISEKINQTEDVKNTRPKILTNEPERKSSRIEQKEKDDQDKVDMTGRLLPEFLNADNSPPAHLQKSASESWTEGCEYFCMLCNKTFTSFAIYKHHIGDVHGLLIEDYRAKFGKVGEVIKKYECCICHQEVVHKFTTLKVHMKTVHQMSLEQYHSLYIKPKEDPVEAGERVELSETQTEDRLWYEGEPHHQYQCLICCAKLAHKYSNISSHLSLIHDLSIQEYELEYLQHKPTEREQEGQGEVVTAADNEVVSDGIDDEMEETGYEFTEADIIIEEPREEDEESINDTEDQMTDIRQVHNMIIQDYDARHMEAEGDLEGDINMEPMTALEETAANPCHEITPMKPLLPPPPPLKASPAALAARKNTEAAASPHFAFQSGQKGSITFDSRPASQWYHGSDLSCEICQKQFVDFTYYCTHIRTVHQISKEQYNEKYGTGREAFRLYRCLVCGISIKWTYQSICGHLKSHEITIKEYENKYNVLDNQSTDSGKISELTMNANAGTVLITDDGPLVKKPKMSESESIPQIVPPLQRKSFGYGKPTKISADISSPTGKWYNQCKFTCKACPEYKYFTVPQALRMHLNGIHNLSRKEYEAQYGMAETVTRYWTCLICNKELKCQKGIIIQHLLNVHSMELVDYERQYMDAGDQVVARESRKPRRKRAMVMTKDSSYSYGDPSDLSHFLVQRMDEGVDNVSLEGPAITEEITEEPPVMDENITSMSSLEVEGMENVPWYFGCRYSCQICNKVWHYPQAARYHLDSVHKLTRASYEAQYGTCEVETRIFHCSICQRTMKCERDIIKYHLEAKHSMSLEDYVDQFPRPIVTIGESRRSNAATHARTANTGQSSSVNQSKVGSDLNSSSEEAGLGKAPWYRGSSFTCIPCNRPFTAQVSYISHINTKHGMNLREYRDQFGNAEEIKQYNCRVPGCTRYVAWTYSGINDHLKSHNLSMAQYEQQYLGIGVGSVTSSVVSPQHKLIKTITVSDSATQDVEPEDFSTVVENWASGSVREWWCSICRQNVVGSRQTFISHLLEKHQITETEYSLQYDDISKEDTDSLPQHSCHLCNEMVEHKLDVLRSHMEAHNISLEHYYHKFIRSTNEDATNAEIITANAKNSVISEPRPQIQITSVSTLSDTSPIKVRKNHWANGCSYQCVLCKGKCGD